MDVDESAGDDAINEIMSPKRRNVKSPQATPKSTHKRSSSGSHSTVSHLFGTFFTNLVSLPVLVLTQVSSPIPPLSRPQFWHVPPQIGFRLGRTLLLTRWEQRSDHRAHHTRL